MRELKIDKVNDIIGEVILELNVSVKYYIWFFGLFYMKINFEIRKSIKYLNF